ncbi:DgyrCDS2947 [Dimorphilus gyrociliatus]|uniref:DgyrCDS2947 n=1 Tax=Dimorphilus gyrociliatus TaxID=2664684 RepID=A0A7I8VET0_9ANNE|nr:DgyrCDS2947 [Dimorphilus gyrociliatus]
MPSSIEKVIDDSNSKSQNEKNSSKAGIVFTSILGASVIGLTTVCYAFVRPALRKICLPFVPATQEQISNVLKLLNGRSGKVIDLGSGDGRIVIECAKKGFQAEGIELNRWLIYFSRYSAFRHNVQNRTKFYCQDLWKMNYSNYNNIVIFGVEPMMQQLKEKLVNEMPSDDHCLIVCRFPLPNTVSSKIVGEGIDTVWLYKKRDLLK